MSSYYCCPHGITATLFTQKIFSKTLKKTYGYQITANLNNSNFEPKTKKNNIIEIFHKKNISHEDFKNLQTIEKIINDLLKGYLEKLITEDKNDSCEYNKKEISKIELNSDQHKAYECVIKNKNAFKTFLLYGPTGSGKTEVYITIAKQLNKMDKQVLIMVPEINLTPQLEANLKSRFESKYVCVYHSGVSNIEKKKNYDNVKSGKIKTIIELDSLFLSFKSLGAIIVDEEYDDFHEMMVVDIMPEISHFIFVNKKIPLLLILPHHR